MRKVFLALMTLVMFVGIAWAETIPSATDPANQIDRAVLDQYMPKPTNWNVMTAEQQRNFRQSQLTYYITKIVPQLENKTAGIDEESNSHLINKMAVTMNGPTLKGLKAADKENASAIAVFEKALLMAAGKTDTEISEFYKLNPVKDIEKRQAILTAAWKKLAEKPVISWNSPEAQTAIKSWVEKNMLGGKTLEQVMGKDVKTGKVNTDAIALLDANYAGKQELDVNRNSVAKLEGDLGVVNNNFVALSEQMNQHTAQLTTLSNDVIDPLIDKVATLQLNASKDNAGKVTPMASQTDLDTKLATKADKTEVNELKETVNNVRDGVVELALDKKTEGLCYLYASYYNEGKVDKFKEFLKAKCKRNWQDEFDKIIRASEKMLQAGRLKLQAPSNTTQQTKAQK